MTSYNFSKANRVDLEHTNVREIDFFVQLGYDFGPNFHG